MDKMLCPRCQSSFYTVDPESDLPCPFCGFILKEDHFKKRMADRTLVQKECDLIGSDIHIHGQTLDISEEGVGFEGSGDMPFSEEDIIDILVDDLELSCMGKVVWTKRYNGKFRAGLKFLK